MRKKADMGIGTLIIFIAMILVAAIAAGVLIQTATSLQNKALLTGERSKSQVSTSIRPIVVYAEDGSTSNNVDQFYMTLKLAPGSDAVKFEDLLLEFSLKNLSTDITYNVSNNCSSLNVSSTELYFIQYLVDGENQEAGYLQRGDVVKLCFRSGRAVLEDESISITLVPKVGSPTVVQTALPDIITEQRINIFP
jgi:archaeal flagellin FlaB